MLTSVSFKTQNYCRKHYRDSGIQVGHLIKNSFALVTCDIDLHGTVLSTKQNTGSVNSQRPRVTYTHLYILIYKYIILYI